MEAQPFDRDLSMSGAAGTVNAGANNLKDKATHALDGAAGHVERAGHSVSDRVATYADKAAGALGSTAQYVRDIDSRDVMEDITAMAKRHPGVTLAAAAVVGFLAGRAATRS